MTSTHEAPSGPVETFLAQVWTELLGVEGIGRHDDFFELGGHSILAMGMLARIRQVMQVELSMTELFRHPQLAAFAEIVNRAHAVAAPPTVAAARTGEAPLAAAQKRIWFMEQMAPGSSAHSLYWALRIRGPLEVDALEQSVVEVQRRHDVLRSLFVAGSDGPVQRPQPDPRAAIRVDLSAMDAESREAEVVRLAHRCSLEPFELEREPPLRVHLVKLSADDWALFVNLHHIAGDGWSQEIFFRELAVCYEAFANAVTPDLEPVLVQYADVANAERQWLASEECAAQLRYWKQQLGGELQPIQLERSAAPGSQAGYRGKAVFRELAPALLQSWHALCRQEGITLFMGLLAVFQVLLHRLNGKTDILVGTDFAQRIHSENRNLIGLFVNQIVLRTDLSGHPTFREVLGRARRVTIEAFAHPDVPFDRVVQELSPARDPASTPLFQIMFVLQTATAEAVRLPGLNVTAIPVPLEAAPFELTVAFAETAAGTLRVDCRYRTDLFQDAAIARLMDQMEVLLQSAAHSPDSLISDLEILTPAEAQEEARRRERRRQGKFEALQSARPVPIGSSAESLMRVEDAGEGRALPLVIRPAVEGVALQQIARLHAPWIERHLQQHGAILLRGFGLSSVEQLGAFTGALTSGPLEYRERSSPRSSLGAGVYTSTDYPADQSIALHTEQSYTLNWPMKLFFGCLRKADTGGHTPLADTRRVLARLNRRTVALFEERGVLYVRNYGDGLGLSWQEAFQTTDRKEVEAQCARAQIECIWKSAERLQTRQRRPAIRRHPHTGEPVWFNHAFFFNVASLTGPVRDALLAQSDDVMPFQSYFGDGMPIPGDILGEIQQAIEAETVVFAWEEGDVLIIDNMLVAHGRTPYTGPRQIVVSMAEPCESSMDDAQTEQRIHVAG